MIDIIPPLFAGSAIVHHALREIW